MSMAVPYPLQLEVQADRRITRWRPLVQWLLVIPHLLIANALRSLRQVLTLISFFTVVFTERIPRPLFDVIVMTYRYEWRAMSYAFFMHEDYPPFDFALSSEDDGLAPHTSLRLAYPEHLGRWQPLYKWFLAIPHYLVLVGLAVAASVGIVAGFFTVLVTGRYPEGIRNFVVSSYRYTLRVEAYVGFLTDRYPPFTLAR
jgi:bacteriorhodopsin